MNPARSVLVLVAAVATAFPTARAIGSNWPSWRGPNQDQTSPDAHFPVSWKWSPDGASKNVRWRTALPERGNSSPVIWGDRVFVTQAVEDGKKRTVMCFERALGTLLWQKGVSYDQPDTRHDMNTHCAGSPVTDGKRVIASFGSAGIVAYDFDGKELWKADLGPQTHIWGPGSSPMIFNNLVLVYHSPGKDSALYALDKSTGKIKWKVALPEEQPGERFDGYAGKADETMGSWATPLVIGSRGHEEAILPADNKLRAFAPKTGESLWTIDGVNPLVYASASYGEGKIVSYGGYFGSAIVAKPGGHGDATASNRISYEKRIKRHRIGTPIIHDGYIYFSNTIGVAECVELTTGKTVWDERLPATKAAGETWGSMVLAEGRLYVINQSGDTFVLKAAPKYELLSVNPVGELANSTPALADGEVYIRTERALYCFHESAEVLKP